MAAALPTSLAASKCGPYKLTSRGRIARSRKQRLRPLPVSPSARVRSQLLFERAQKSLIEGVNSPSRGAAVYSPGPVYLERGHGSQVWDADGNQYTDFMMSFGALIHGHDHPEIIQTVS